MRHNVLRSWVNRESSPGKRGQTKLHLKTLLVVDTERCHQAPLFRVTSRHCTKVVYPGGMCQECVWCLAQQHQVNIGIRSCLTPCVRTHERHARHGGLVDYPIR